MVVNLWVCVCLTTLMLIIVQNVHRTVIKLDPDDTVSFSELIASQGYFLQEYHVLTEDGYILTVHRVVPRDYEPVNYNIFRKPVIGMHGIFNDATYFYYNSPHILSNNSFCGDNFGFCMLRSERYDFWVPNLRGNGRNDHHIRYSTKDKRFWKFSWDHMTVYDLPAIIDFVRTKTGHKTVAYVGFSQGTTTMFALLSLKSQYANIIRPFIAWGPAVFLNRATSVIGPALRNFHQIAIVPGVFPIGNPMVNSLQQWYICRTRHGAEFCNQLINVIFGQSNVNVTRISTYANFGPNPSSNWQVTHFGQNGQSGRFQRFNYGSTKANMRAYGQPSPPDYPLQNIPKNFKILILHGATDAVIHPLDARKLISTLKTNGVDVTAQLVQSSKGAWSHWDFLGENSGKYVNDHTLRYLDLYAWDNKERYRKVNYSYG